MSDKDKVKATAFGVATVGMASFELETSSI